MKRFCLLILSTIPIYLFFACNDSSNPTTVTQIVIVRDTIVWDTTESLDTVKTGVATFDNIVSDTVLTIEKTIKYMITIKTISDTIYRYTANVESSFVDLYISEWQIRDSIFTGDSTVHSDSLLLFSDTILKVNLIIKDTISFETIFHQKTESDTQYYSTWVVATTADWASNTGNVGIGAVEEMISDPDYTGDPIKLLIHSDNSVFTYNGSIYILERFGADNLMRITGAVISPSHVVYQKNLGTAVNLHDISFVNDIKAYITQYNSDTLLIVNPQNGNITGKIDLGMYGMFSGTDSAEVPFMECSKVIGDKAFILCQRLQTVQTSIGPVPQPTVLTGCIVVISTVNDSIIKAIELKKKNPSSMDVTDGFLYVSSTGKWSDPADGGVEKINLSTLDASTVVIEESAFGSNISRIAMANGTKGYVAVSKNNDDWTEFWTEIIEFNPVAGTVGLKIEGIDDAFGGFVYDGTYLYIGDRSKTKPGVVIVNPIDNSKVAGPLKMGAEAPNSVAVLTVGTND